MKLKTIVLFITFISFSMLLSGQTERLSFKIDAKSTRWKKETYSLQNYETKDLAFLISERKQIHAHLFNQGFGEISNFIFDKPKSKYDSPLGYTVNGNNYNLLYANSRFNDFIIITVNFDSKTATKKELDFDLDDELFIDTVLHNDNLFFISSDEQKIVIRSLSKDNTLNVVKSFDIKDISTNKWIYQGYEASWGFFFNSIEESNFTKIDHRVPISIEQASTPNKIYKFENNLILTLDDNENGTLTYNIDLNTLDISEKSFTYPKGKIDDFKRYNSFVYNNKVFQFASSRKEMNFSIKDQNDKILKEFYLTKEDSITFINGPIVQEGQTMLPFQSKRELEASSKYLRKISSGDIGISVLKVDNLYEVTLGGYKIVPTTTIGFGVGGGTTFAGAGVVNFGPVFNPTFFNYNSFGATKATFFDTVLTENFEHVKKEFEPSLNQRIDDFMVDYKGITGEDLFFIGKKPFYAYFNQKMKEFVLIEF